MNEVIHSVDSVADKSAGWFLILVIGGAAVTGWFIIKYLVEIYREANKMLLESERGRSVLILEMSKEREKLNIENNAKTESLIRETMTTQQRIADTLERFERALENLQKRT